MKQRNIKLTLEYDGSRFFGWQKQNTGVKGGSKRTVQRVIESALRKLFGERIDLQAAGRTDAGVHALGQTANFKVSSGLSCDRIQYALNAFLPEDISVVCVEDVPAGFHSRFSAGCKLYRYSILNRRAKPALLRERVLHCTYALDLSLMRREAEKLLGRHDFKAFQNSGSPRKGGTIRIISDISIKRERKTRVINIEITADGFLYNMARNIAGTLIDIARGKLPEGSISRILSSADRRFAGESAPAQGLCLVKVFYDNKPVICNRNSVKCL